MDLADIDPGGDQWYQDRLGCADGSLFDRGECTQRIPGEDLLGGRDQGRQNGGEGLADPDPAFGESHCPQRGIFDLVGDGLLGCREGEDVQHRGLKADRSVAQLRDWHLDRGDRRRCDHARTHQGGSGSGQGTAGGDHVKLVSLR